MKVYKFLLISVVIIIIDQTSKLLVYKYMELGTVGEIKVIGDWFRLHYLLNPGMAFGIRWENEFGKLALTIFRILAMFGIGYYLWKMAKSNAHTGFLVCMALILGGAVGNVIDSTFYGVLLQNHPVDSPTPWFHGQVIDMLFFPLFEFTWPSWVPFVGNEYFLFFSPVFNVADSSIFVGVVIILLFQRRFFKEKTEHNGQELTSTPSPENIDPAAGETNEVSSSISEKPRDSDV
jgi:signal peptidase II